VPSDVLIRRNGLHIAIGGMDGAPIPQDVNAVLAPTFTYKFTEFLRGRAAYTDQEGKLHQFRVEHRNMFSYDFGHRMVTGHGLYKRACDLLRQRGHRVFYQDLTPPRRRPNCYEPDWGRLANEEFRARQRECVESLAREECGIVSAPMGFGKTELMRMLAKLFPFAKIHIVVKRVSIARAIERRLLRATPNVGFVGDGDCRFSRVTVIVADSLHRSDGDCDILLCDEAHMLASPSYAYELGEKYKACRTFAFSATIDARMDGAGDSLRYMFGDTIFHMTYPEAVTLGLVVPIFVHWLVIDDGTNPAAGKTGIQAERWGIWRNDYRNDVFCEHARRWPAEMQTLMLVSKVEHATELHKRLPDYAICCGDREPGANWPKDLPRMTPERRINMQNAFEDGRLKKVIATDVWSTGVDFKHLQIVYRLDARSSEEICNQGPGRASRLDDGKDWGLVVDGYDKFDKFGFLNKSRTRRRHYRANEWQDDWPRFAAT